LNGSELVGVGLILEVTLSPARIRTGLFSGLGPTSAHVGDNPSQFHSMRGHSD
jgi:hypothetical protein